MSNPNRPNTPGHIDDSVHGRDQTWTREAYLRFMENRKPTIEPRTRKSEASSSAWKY